MYVVAGVTGNTGSVVAETLLSQRKEVRVVVRDEAKGAPWKAKGASVAIAELDDVGALTRALTGAEAAYLLLPPQMQSTSPRADNARRSAGYLEAIDRSGVPHVVFLSSIAAHLDRGTGPILSAHDGEIALRKSRAKITALRAASFMENWGSSLFALGQGLLPSFIKGDAKVPTVASKDIGATAAKALLEGATGSSVIELAGPRELTPKDVAAALSRVTGKSITLQVGPEEAMVGALTSAGINPSWAALFQEMTHGLNTGHVAWERGAARAVRGTTEIDEVLRVLLARG